MEAQACGLPAVVRDAGGVAECLAPGKTGVVIPVEDEPGYWSSLEALLDDDPLRQSMAAAARGFAASRTWEDVREGFLALCQEVSGRGGRSGQFDPVDPVGVAV